MNEKKYKSGIKTELLKLTKLAEKREVEQKFTKISKLLAQWKKKPGTYLKTLKQLQEEVESVPSKWSESADIGYPVAHAILKGTLTKKDMSVETWESVEVMLRIISDI